MLTPVTAFAFSAATQIYGIFILPCFPNVFNSFFMLLSNSGSSAHAHSQSRAFSAFRRYAATSAHKRTFLQSGCRPENSCKHDFRVYIPTGGTYVTLTFSSPYKAASPATNSLSAFTFLFGGRFFTAFGFSTYMHTLSLPSDSASRASNSFSAVS